MNATLLSLTLKHLQKSPIFSSKAIYCRGLSVYKSFGSVFFNTKSTQVIESRFVYVLSSVINIDSLFYKFVVFHSPVTYSRGTDTLVVDRCTFSDIEYQEEGAAVYYSAQGVAVVTGCSFIRCKSSSSNGKGGLAVNSDQAKITNCCGSRCYGLLSSFMFITGSSTMRGTNTIQCPISPTQVSLSVVYLKNGQDEMKSLNITGSEFYNFPKKMISNHMLLALELKSPSQISYLHYENNTNGEIINFQNSYDWKADYINCIYNNPQNHAMFISVCDLFISNAVIIGEASFLCEVYSYGNAIFYHSYIDSRIKGTERVQLRNCTRSGPYSLISFETFTYSNCNVLEDNDAGYRIVYILVILTILVFFVFILVRSTFKTEEEKDEYESIVSTYD